MKYSQKSHSSAGYRNMTVVLFTLLCVLICGSLALPPKAQTKTSDEQDVTPKTVPGRNGKIVFSGGDGIGAIYTTEADGSNVQRLTNNPRHDISPRWLPDGTKIAFESRRDNKLVAIADQPGTLSVWGDDSAHQITDAPTGEFRAIAKGGAFQGLAIRSDGTLVLWGGYNDPLAVPPVPAAIAGDEFVSVAIGRSHALAFRPDGSVVGWGNNSSGQLNAPTDVRFDAITAGNSHSIGLAEDGTLYGWGANAFGQANVPAGRFTAIAARTHYSLALRDDGTLFGWGANASGIFNTWASDGQGHFYVPDKKFKGIAAGNFHALAINVDKTVEAWGNNSTGQLNVPAGVRFKEVAGGFGYSVGVTVNGTLIAWGDNSMVQLNVPPGKFETVSAAAFHASAIAK